MRCWLVAILISQFYCVSVEAGGLDSILFKLSGSELVFQKSFANAPFAPLAFVTWQQYGESQLTARAAETTEFKQTHFSQALIAPWLTSQRDLILLGEYTAWNRFEESGNANESFSVWSLGVPVAWVRQLTDTWQSAAFLLPFIHQTDLIDTQPVYELMAGAFARYLHSESLWWGFGVFADVDPQTELYLPYLGLSWAYTRNWTFSAIMPWPAIVYAPSQNTAVRLGLSPSSASWELSNNAEQVFYHWDGWNLGVKLQRRVLRNWWVEAEIGLAGLRTLGRKDSGWRAPDLDAKTSPFLGVSFSWRP